MTFETLTTDTFSRDQALAKLWAKRNEFEDQDKLKEFEQLENEIKQVAILNLTVAFDLTQEEMLEISLRIRKMFKKNLFLDLRVDPKLIGGCSFVWEGVVHDYSLKKTMLEKRPEVMRFVNSVFT